MKMLVRALVAMLALLVCVPASAQTEVESNVYVEGTGAVPTGGLSFSFLSPIPVQTTSGVTVIDYRISNSTGSQVTFGSIAATSIGDAKSKFGVVMGHPTRDVGAGGFADSTITVTTTESMYDGDVATVRVSGLAGSTPVSFILAVEGTGAVPTGGLTIEWLDAVPVQVASGIYILDYRVHNSTGAPVTFSSIVLTLSGDHKSKLTPVLGSTSFEVPNTGSASADSTITLTTVSPMFDGEVVLAKLSGLAGSTPIASRFEVDGISAVDSGGLTIEWLSPIPVQFESGVEVVDYRVHNSGVLNVDFESIVATASGDSKNKVTLELGATSLLVPGSGSIDSTVTVTAISGLLEGDVIGIALTGTATLAGGDFAITIIASRTTGEVPFGVNFTIVGSTDPGGSNIYHECVHNWDSTGSVAPTAVDNAGFNYGAVYDTPGTYTVTCNMITPGGEVGYDDITVTASAWSGSTRYVDPDIGVDSAVSPNGTDPATPWATLDYARTQLSGINDWRLLLDEDDVHALSSTFSVVGKSHIRIGRYDGTGRVAIDRGIDTVQQGFSFSNCTDFGLYNLELRGVAYSGHGPPYAWTDTTATVENQSSLAIGALEGFDDALFWNCVSDGFGQGISLWGGSTTGYNSNIAAVIHSCQVIEATTINFGYVSHHDDGCLSVISTLFDGMPPLISPAPPSTAGHTFRTPSMRRSWWYDTELTNNRHTGQHTININGRLHDGGDNNDYRNQSKHNWFSHCRFGGGATAGNTVAQAQSGGTAQDEHISDTVFDSCEFNGSTRSGSAHLGLGAIDTTVRNCTFRGGSTRVGITTRQFASVSVGGFRIIGNSVYDTSVNSHGFVDITTTTGPGQTVDWGVGTFGSNVVKNNALHLANYAAGGGYFMWVPDETKLADVEDSNNVGWFSGGTESNRIYISILGGTNYTTPPVTAWTWGAPPSGHGVNALYENPDFVSATDLHLQAGSPCIDIGEVIEMDSYRDIDGNLRGSTVDVGADEYTP